MEPKPLADFIDYSEYDSDESGLTASPVMLNGWEFEDASSSYSKPAWEKIKQEPVTDFINYWEDDRFEAAPLAADCVMPDEWKAEDEDIARRGK